MKLASFAILALALLPTALKAQFNYPGGIVQLRIAKQSSEVPEIRYGLREPVIIETETHWRVLIGISLETLPGEYLVYLKRATESSEDEYLKISVEQKEYPLFDETEGNQNAVLTRPRKKLSDIDFSNTQQPSLPLKFPTDGDWSSNFGHQIYDDSNRQLDSLNGISMTTTKLATVVSPQNAIVLRVETDEQNLATVYLDHGRGLFSILQGLNDITVEAGNGVIAGAVLGKLPGAKSNTAPSSLIWQTQLNGAFVNPLILTELTLK